MIPVTPFAGAGVVVRPAVVPHGRVGPFAVAVDLSVVTTTTARTSPDRAAHPAHGPCPSRWWRVPSGSGIACAHQRLRGQVQRTICGRAAPYMGVPRLGRRAHRTSWLACIPLGHAGQGEQDGDCGGRDGQACHLPLMRASHSAASCL